MNRIPRVATYRIAVLDPDSRECREVLFVDAPNQRLAILNARHEYPSTWMKPILVTRLASRVAERSRIFEEYHLDAARKLALKRIRSDERSRGA